MDKISDRHRVTYMGQKDSFKIIYIGMELMRLYKLVSATDYRLIKIDQLKKSIKS